MKKLRLRKTDFLWLPAFPIYQTIGTIRHEGSHALMAMAQGAEIQEFVFWPSVQHGRFFWGYVRWEGITNWLTTAAPYFCDFLTFLLFYFICTRIHFKRRWIWVNLVIIGMLSPFVNSAYAYIRGIMGTSNDFSLLIYDLPNFTVHAYFFITLILYIFVLYFLFASKHFQ